VCFIGLIVKASCVFYRANCEGELCVLSG
jgi:hypothetical protein